MERGKVSLKLQRWNIDKITKFKGGTRNFLQCLHNIDIVGLWDFTLMGEVV